MAIRPKVSIIIPVYMAEDYIAKCVRTLFEQTLDDIEYIFIDDCSPDNSIAVMYAILKQFPQRQSQVRVIRNIRNQGVGQTRQRGIDEARGEYIIHCDPDDWVEPNMYAIMYEEAQTNGSDIVICEYYEEKSNHSITYPQQLKQDKKELLHCITNATLPAYLWNKLIRRDFVINSGYRIASDVSLWEDQMYIIPL